MWGDTDRSYVIKVMIVFLLGWAVIYADRTVLYPMLNIIGKDLGLTATQGGLITSVYFFFYVAMQVPSGILGDKYCLKKVLVVMFFLAGVSLLLMGILPPAYLTLMVLVALHGTGGGAYFPAAMGITLETVPKKMRGLSTAIVSSGMSIGLALGLISAGPIYNYFSNWRMPFLILSIPTIILALVFHFVLRECKPSPTEKGPISWMLRERNLMLICVASFASQYGFWTVVTWGPTFLQTERGLGMTVSGLYTAIVAFTAIPASLTIGNSSDRFGRKKLSLLLLSLAALTVFATGYVQSLRALIIVLICYGLFGKLTWDPIEISWFADHVSAIRPELMGTSLAFFNFIGMSAAIVAPVISGWLKDTTGSLQTSFYLGGAILALGALCLFFVDETVNMKT